MKTDTQVQMPKYSCNKKVWALQIKAVDILTIDMEGALSFFDEGYSDIHVSSDYMNKHKPVAGGYYVVYGDGYKSFSPAKAFEEGYQLINV